MIRSDQINELAAALSSAQATITGAVKDSNNPFFKSKYADLASVWDAIRRPLTDNGLAISQMPTTTEQGLSLETILMHSSGQFISSTFHMKSEKAGPQADGSLLSYMRRYALTAIMGVPQIDDDGHTAQHHPAEQHEKKAPLKPHEESIKRLEKQISTMPDHVHTWRPYKFDSTKEQCDYRHGGKFCNAIRSIGPDFDKDEKLPF